MAAASKTYPPAWWNFLGTLLLLIGAYMGMRTAVNMLISPKYPTTPTTTLSLTNTTQITEDTCSFSSVGGAGTPDESCLKYVANARETARMVDISNSLFFLFTGGGILYSRKRLYK